MGRDFECPACHEYNNVEMHLALDVLNSAGVVFEDERVGYVEIQVDRVSWLAWLDSNQQRSGSPSEGGVTSKAQAIDDQESAQD